MPRPPILPQIDWRAVFASGASFSVWLSNAEHPNHRDAMAAEIARLSIPAELRSALAQVTRAVHVVAIAEDWCGDVVRHVPALALLEREMPSLQVRYVSREQHPDVFVRYLTNGGEAIPKFIFLNDQFVECGNWGPMPADCRALIARGKARGDVGAARAQVSQRYQADGELRAAFEELVELLNLAAGN